MMMLARTKRMRWQWAYPEYANTIRSLVTGANSSLSPRFAWFQYRLEGMQGAILRVKLRHRKRWTEARWNKASIYDELLRGSGVVPPARMPYARHVTGSEDSTRR